MKSFAKYLPSKGFFAVSGAVLFSFALVGGVYALNKSGAVSQNQALVPVLASAGESAALIQNELSNKDSDGDGLKDWEENLWGTDLKNKDTDGDGTSDGEEVAEKRNPLIKGPNDKIETFSADENSDSTENTPLTTTDKIARITFSRYMQVKDAGGTIDQNFQNQLINEVLTAESKDLNPARIYTEGDLHTVEGSKENLKAYGERMGVLIKNANWKVDELSVIQSALDKENESLLSKLDIPISGYKNIIDESIKMDVPKNATREHLLVVNAMSKMVSSLEAIKLSFKDPAYALVVFGKYPEYVTELHRAFIDVQGLFSRQNINYTETEAGIIYARFADIVASVSK